MFRVSRRQFLLNPEDNFLWYLMGLNGPHKDAIKSDLCKEFSGITNELDEPWHISGDLNALKRILLEMRGHDDRFIKLPLDQQL